MANVPSKPTVQNQEWINGETKLNQTNLTNGVNQNITNLKTAVDGVIDAMGGPGAAVDTTPTQNSIGLCTSGGIYEALLGTEIVGTLDTEHFTENGAGYYRLFYTPRQMVLTVASRVIPKQNMPAGNGDTYDFVNFTIPEAIGNKLYPIHSATLADTGTLRNMAGAFNTGHPGYWLRIRKIDSTHIRVQIVTTTAITDPITTSDNMQIADSTTFIL